MRWCCGASSIAPADPPLTAEQLAEKEKEAELIAAQLAKPSYWDEVGPDKPNASALKAALADTVLVDAAWLVRLAKKRGVLPRCQDLPPGARVTLEEMEKWKDDFTVCVVVISYPWWAPPSTRPLAIAPQCIAPAASARYSRPATLLAHRLDADHPDKDGLQLRKIAKVLKLFDEHAKKEYGAGCKVGVFLDYVSMPQRSRGSPEDDRTPEELATFKRSLQVRRRHCAALPHRPPPTPALPAPLCQGPIRGMPTVRHMCSSSIPTSRRARRPTFSRTRGVGGA